MNFKTETFSVDETNKIIVFVSHNMSFVSFGLGEEGIPFVSYSEFTKFKDTSVQTSKTLVVSMIRF